MSRIGKLPIPLPAKVKVVLDGNLVSVSGPKGTLARELPPRVQIRAEGNELLVSPEDESVAARAAWGLARTLVANMVHGVSEGFKRELVVEGVGYRAAARGKEWVTLTLGYSHPILYELPEGVTAEVDPKTFRITLEGIDKEKLGLAAATIRSFRPPEPYKGKGVHYATETVRRKVGKAGGK